MILRNLAFVALVANAAALDFSSSTWIWTNDSVSTSGGSATPPGADILITGDENFTLYVNGEQLGTGANYHLGYAFRAPLRSSGLNVFAVTATSDSTSPTPPGVLVAINLTYSDGTSDIIVSNTTWRALSSVPDGYQNLRFDDRSWPAAVGKGAHNPNNPPTFTITNVTNWIWTNETTDPASSALSGSRPFRLSWTPPPGQTPRSATISVCADDAYAFFVNGILVAGGYLYSACQQFSISLAPAAEVVFAANATNGGGPAGFLAEIQVTTTGAPGSSSSSFVVTDTDWKWTSTVPAGFEDPGFDDSSWFPAVLDVGYAVPSQ
ncbi:hypothetical protein B0H12DRAFT_1166091 [Mycena haematopus]|nr:hypothetical protein B0H12DRAFT_1166091 [Mycena haematopus]